MEDNTTVVNMKVYVVSEIAIGEWNEGIETFCGSIVFKTLKDVCKHYKLTFFNDNISCEEIEKAHYVIFQHRIQDTK